jgi:uncharacterized protein with HEPN domain
MSDDAKQREWSFYLADMIQFAERIRSYTDEVASHIPQAVRFAAPHIPWRLIIGMRNRLIHGYLGVDNDTVWSVITTDIPQLLTDLRALAADAG